MLELADIVTAYGGRYRKKYGARMLPSHWDALWDIEHCRSSMMGGETFWCELCQTDVYSDHSCGNRHCPKCGGDRADAWRDRQMETLLAVPYFLVTVTLPHPLNPLMRSHQKLCYDLLFTSSADALKTLAWKPSHPKFLVPASALREVFRAKFRDALTAVDSDLFAQVPATTWSKKWVVHSKPVGDGETALKYLTPYIARVALSNARLVKMEQGKVTFRYKPRGQAWRRMTLDAMSFLQRFLQHVLPQGFQKIRYSGFLHPGARKTLTALQEQLATNDAPSSQLPDALASTFGFEVA